MFKKTLICALMLLFSTLTFAQNKSVYTSLIDNKCKIQEDAQVPGNMNGLCPGVGGYNLKIFADDERMSVSVVAANQKTFDLDFWGYFGNFSSVGERAEWRVKGKTPVGLIVRYNVSDRGEGKPPTSYLMVSKVSLINSCLIAIVKPGKNQNIQARKLADAAVNKPCKKIE